jgi:hypothetical protein
VGNFHFKFVFLSISCVFLCVDELFVAVDGRDAGGHGGGTRGDRAELAVSLTSPSSVSAESYGGGTWMSPVVSRPADSVSLTR